MDEGILPSRKTIFHGLLDQVAGNGTSDHKHPRPSLDNLAAEGQAVTLAASDTTGNAMTQTTFRVLRDPEIYENIKKELETAYADPKVELRLPELEKLPYLTAVIKEGLR